MMGSRGVKTANEYDTLTRARRFFRYRSGTVKKQKRIFWKRMRRIAKRDPSYGDG